MFNRSCLNIPKAVFLTVHTTNLFWNLNFFNRSCLNIPKAIFLTVCVYGGMPLLNDHLEHEAAWCD